MDSQPFFYDLELPLYHSKFVFCGKCATLHPIAKACGQHFEFAHFDLSDFDSVGRWTLSEGDDSGLRTNEKLHKYRGGVVYAVVKDRPRIDLKSFAAGLAAIHPEVSPADFPAFVQVQLGYRRSTASKGHLALKRLNDCESGSELTCWNCDTSMSISRGNLARAVEHALEFGGTIVASTDGIKVPDSSVRFQTSKHLTSAVMPAVEFRRGNDFVAAGHVEP